MDLAPQMFSVITCDAFDGNPLPVLRATARQLWDALSDDERASRIADDADVDVSVEFDLRVCHNPCHSNVRMLDRPARQLGHRDGPVGPYRGNLEEQQ